MRSASPRPGTGIIILVALVRAGTDEWLATHGALSHGSVEKLVQKLVDQIVFRARGISTGTCFDRRVRYFFDRTYVQPFKTLVHQLVDLHNTTLGKRDSFKPRLQQFKKTTLETSPSKNQRRNSRKAPHQDIVGDPFNDDNLAQPQPSQQSAEQEDNNMNSTGRKMRRPWLNKKLDSGQEPEQESIGTVTFQSTDRAGMHFEDGNLRISHLETGLQAAALAETVDLAIGDEIFSCDDKPVNTISELKAAILTKSTFKTPYVLKFKRAQRSRDQRPTGSGNTDSNRNEPITDWHKFGLATPLLRAIDELGFREPTPVQSAVILEALRHRDILAAAPTGSGKTLAFGLPVLNQLFELKCAGTLVNDRLHVLIVAPTRELAKQIVEHLSVVAKHTGVRAALLVGGMAHEKQARLLKKRPEIVVGTPGRLWDLISSDGDTTFNELHKLRFLVIDEADRISEKGYFHDFEKILAKVVGNAARRCPRQTFVFSATLFLNDQDAVARLCQIKEDHARVDMCIEHKLARGLAVNHILCGHEDKINMLYYFLHKTPGRTLVFANSIPRIRRLVEILQLLDLPVFGLHAHMLQRQRLHNLDKFKSHNVSVLIATDVAARGLDIKGVQHVFHYDLPHQTDLFVHRSGRTARASQEGVAVALVTGKDESIWRRFVLQLNRGEDVETFPVEDSLLVALEERVRLAEEIARISSQRTRSKNDRMWFEKASKTLELPGSRSFSTKRNTPSEDTDEDMEQDIILLHRRSTLKKLLREPPTLQDVY